MISSSDAHLKVDVISDKQCDMSFRMHFGQVGNVTSRANVRALVLHPAQFDKRTNALVLSRARNYEEKMGGPRKQVTKTGIASKELIVSKTKLITMNSGTMSEGDSVLLSEERSSANLQKEHSE